MSVYHVSYNGESEDIETGILSASTMNKENPSIYHFMETQETDSCQFEKGNGQVIVTREPATKYENSVIQ